MVRRARLSVAEVLWQIIQRGNDRPAGGRVGSDSP